MFPDSHVRIEREGKRYSLLVERLENFYPTDETTAQIATKAGTTTSDLPPLPDHLADAYRQYQEGQATVKDAKALVLVEDANSETSWLTFGMGAQMVAAAFPSTKLLHYEFGGEILSSARMGRAEEKNKKADDGVYHDHIMTLKEVDTIVTFTKNDVMTILNTAMLRPAPTLFDTLNTNAA